jgi:hypothetical protein
MGLRKWAITVLVILVILSFVAPCGAWSAGKRLVTIGDMFWGGEFAKWKTTATLFHNQNQAATDTEALAIAFPNAGVTDILGNPSVATATLGGPTIAQTVADTATASDTGFFQANWCYTAAEDPGGYALTPDISTWHPVKSSSMVGSGLVWPYMTDATPAGGSTMTFKPTINTTPGASNTDQPTVKSSPGNASLKGTNVTASNMSSGVSMPSFDQQRKPSYYKGMKKPEIQNLSGMDKMFRNANRKNTNTEKFYNGTVDRPTTILPMEKPVDVIKPADKTKVISDSVNMTQPGTKLRTLFWDL